MIIKEMRAHRRSRIIPIPQKNMYAPTARQKIQTTSRSPFVIHGVAGSISARFVRDVVRSMKVEKAARARLHKMAAMAATMMEGDGLTSEFIEKPYITFNSCCEQGQPL
jgi:hypothetical protein